VLQNISADLKLCHERAEEAERRAAGDTDTAMRDSALSLARSWRTLAMSIEFTERLERFLSNQRKR
jgi:hypothetical protein